MRFKTKQIDALIDGVFLIGNFASGTGTSTDITTVLTTALSTAGHNGTAVPLQQGSSTTNGVIAGIILEVFDTTSKDKIVADGEGNEVYGKLNIAGPVYTLEYYYRTNAGVETAYTFATTQNLDVSIVYRYKFEELPSDFAIKSNSYITQDATASAVPEMINVLLAVTGTNTITSATLAAGKEIKQVISITVNGKDENLQGITVTAAGAVTVNAGTLGYNVETTDQVKLVAIIGII